MGRYRKENRKGGDGSTNQLSVSLIVAELFLSFFFLKTMQMFLDIDQMFCPGHEETETVQIRKAVVYVERGGQIKSG